MTRTMIITAAHIAAYAAILGACAIWRYPDSVAVFVPPFIAALIPVLIFDFAAWRLLHPAATKIEYEDMNFHELKKMCAETLKQLNAADELKEIRDRVRDEGWDPDRLRQIVKSELGGMNRKTIEMILNRENAQGLLYNFLDEAYQSCLPPAVDSADKFVLWVEQNKTKQRFCTVGEGGRLITKRRVSLRESTEAKCEQCGNAIEKTAPRWGVRYGEGEWIFCCPRCRALWIDTGERRRFRDGVGFWEEWTEHDDGKSDYWDVSAVRCEYLARR